MIAGRDTYCSWCKMDLTKRAEECSRLKKPNRICPNCRYYAEAKALRKAEEEEKLNYLKGTANG